MLRPIIASTMLGAVVGLVLAAGVLFARAEDPSSTVSIDNFTFSPKELNVKAGTTVTWTNHDDIPHGIASSNNAFKKSRALDTDDSYSFTFTAPGTYQYFCYIHPHMVGSIIVEAATGSNPSQECYNRTWTQENRGRSSKIRWQMMGLPNRHGCVVSRSRIATSRQTAKSQGTEVPPRS